MRLVIAIALGASLAGVALPSSSLLAQPRQLVVIASGWVVGVYYPIAGAMSRIAYSAPDLNIRAVVESSGASVANAQLVGAGDADLALIQNDIAYYAVRGSALPEFAGRPVTTMTALFTVFSEPVHVVARRAAGVKSVRDLRGKRVILGPSASGTEQNALQILEAYGLRESDLGRALRVEAAAAAEQIREGQVDAAFFTTGLGSVVVLDTLVRGQATLVPIEHAQGQALRQKYPFYTLETIPTAAYKGLAGDVPTVAVRAMVVARSGLPEDLVYRFTRAIFDNLGQLHAADPAARGLTLPTALRGLPIALHPGAARFFTERGVSSKETP
jgi:TRAP transporter TAXI family solute receptor